MGRLLAGISDELSAEVLAPGFDRSRAPNSVRQALRSSYAIPNHASGFIDGPAEHIETARRYFAGRAANGLAPTSMQARVENLWSELEATARSINRIALLADQLESTRCPFQLTWCVDELPFSTPETAGLAHIRQALAATKRSRVVTPHVGAPVRKCGQCGKREAIGGADWTTWRGFQAKLEAEPEIIAGRHFKSKELICGPCAIKRLVGYAAGDGAFPSTSAIAARDWLDRAGDLQELQALIAAIRAVPGQQDDFEPWLYRRTLARDIASVTRYDGAAAAERRERLRALEPLQARVRRALAGRGEKPEPSQYLAAIVFDGDDMGKHVESDPRGVSLLLDRFSARLVAGGEGIIDAHRATRVYVGGDEGLVLVPLANALPLALAIRQSWSGATSEGGAKPRMTLSMGITIFDRESSLGAAITASHAALEEAKSRDGKDALAVTIRTASGSSWTTVAPWSPLPTPLTGHETFSQRGLSDWERAARAIELIRAPPGRRGLATSWAYDVEELLRTLPDEVWTSGPDGRAAIREEVRRITRRRTRPGIDERLADAAAAVWLALDGNSWWAAEGDGGTTSADLQHIIAFIASELPEPPMED
jgi:hypothetical protein